MWRLFPLLLAVGCVHILSRPERVGDVAATAGQLPILTRIGEPPAPAFMDISARSDLSLADLIDIALAQNPATKQAWAVAKGQAYAWYATYGAYLPTVDVQIEEYNDDSGVTLKAGDTIAQTPIGMQTGNFQAFSTTLTAQLLLLDCGARAANVRIAERALEVANWQHQFTIQGIIRDVSNNYYSYLEAKALVASNEENVATATLSAQEAQGLFDAGIRTKIDLLQAKTTLANAYLDLETSKGREADTMADLAKSIGVDPSSKLKIEDGGFVAEPAPLQDAVEVLMTQARTQRADLAAQEAFFYQQKAQWEYRIGVALPTLSAFTDLNRTRYSNSPVVKSYDYTSGVLLDIPLFQGFSQYNQIRQAKAAEESAYWEWRNTEEGALVEVVTAYTQYLTANQNLKTSEEYVSFAQESFDATFAGYREGIQTMVDVLNTQNALANARAKQVQARANWLRALVNIAFATGNLGL